MSGTPLTNSSYTNKDFQSVYAELLDVAKKLSSKWDPSLSNESDPGVVLLKLNAIIADKVNYNIDKNILEFYPETATQEMNVRNIYKQLGYNMPGYMSGSGTIVAQWLGEKRPGNIVLPLFTKITNNDNTIVYCTDAESIIPMTGEQTEISVRAGTPIIVTISGRTKLSISDLDERNRLYLSDTTAAENGVFIRTYRNNTLQNDYNTWRKVNNLLLEPSNTTCFEFGIDSFYGIPYIEFPSDIDTLSPEGFTVTYLRSAGRADNISAQSLKKFFDGNAVVFDESNNQYDLNTDNFSIDNYYAIQNSYDAETIDEARVNYKKVLGTFDTLVTLRDYINEIYFSGLTSNAVVTDRTTDKQNSISVVTNDGVQQKINSTSADMSAFDLKLYALQYVGTPTDFESYNTGFTLISTVEPNAALISYLDGKKSIQHNFCSLAKNKICILKNKYYIGCKIIPTQILNPEHKLELVSNVQQQLFEKLNSHAVSFGEKVDFQTLYDVIINSSVFIKSLSLDNISYYTYAAYFDDQEKYCEVCVSDEHPYIEGYKFGDIFYTSEEMKTSIVGDTTKYYLDTATQNVYQYRLGAYILITDKRSTFRSDIKQNCILSGCTNLFTLQPDFDYNVFQQFLSSQEVDKITTNSVVELTTGESYTVHDNEVIRFYAPALVDVTSYSTFVKYVFYSDKNAELPPNVNYTLGEGEWIAFFWKNTDSDLRFSYYKYGVGTIIHSVIGLSQDETAQSYVSNLPVGNEGRVVQTSVNTFLQQYQTGVLSSQSVVTIKKESSAVLDNYTNDCYFITNKIETHNNINQYVLFSEPEVVSSFTSWGNAISDIDKRTLFDRTNGQNGLIVFRYEGLTEKWYYKNHDGDEILLDNGLADVGITLELPVINSAAIQVASATGSATITNEADLLTMLTNESVTDVYTYTTAWPAGFNPELLGISVGGMWTTGDKITLSFNTGVPIAIATSASGTVTITDAEILKTHLLILNRRRTFTYGGTTWDIDPETNGITLSGTWSNGDTLIAEIDDETISVNFNSKLTESYMLKSNEYFMFKDKAVLKLYGSGTKITRNTVIQQGVYLYPEKWMCRTISPEKILEGGLSAITSSHWFTFYNNRNTLQINEMEFRNVLPGGSIQLEAFQNTDETINATRESHVVIDNSGSVVLSATVRGYNTVAAPYDVDITALYNSHILSEKGTYTLTPWITEDMGAVELGSDNTGLTNSILFTYDGTGWDVDPLTCGLTLSGAWLEGDTITATYTTVISVVVSSTDGEAIVSDENLLKSLLTAQISNIDTLFSKVSQAGTHTFTYNANHKWVYGSEIEEIGDTLISYGITYGGIPDENDTIVATIIRTASNNNFKLVSSTSAIVMEVVGSTYGITSTSSPSSYNIYAEIIFELTSSFDSASITYQNIDDTESTDLAVSSTGDGYEGVSVLSLNVGPDSPQSLYQNQTLILYNEGSVTTVHDESRVINVLSNIVVTSDGGIEQDITQFKFDGTSVLPIISSYIDNNNAYPGNVSLEGKKTKIKLASGTNCYKFNVNYPDGYYILPLYNPNNLEFLKVYFDNEPIISVVSSAGHAEITDVDKLFSYIVEGDCTLEYISGDWKNGDTIVQLSTIGITTSGSWVSGDEINASLTEDGIDVYYNGENTIQVNTTIFKDKVKDFGLHRFSFNGADWVLNNVVVSLSAYGITTTGTFEENEQFIVRYNSIIINEIYDETKVDFSNTGYYYLSVPCFDLSVDGEPTLRHTLRIVGKHSSGEDDPDVTHTITINSLQRIIEPLSYREIKSCAQDVSGYLLNTPYKFDCTYQSQHNIENPLQADSFMNTAHIYNKFTICQAQGADIQLMN